MLVDPCLALRLAVTLAGVPSPPGSTSLSADPISGAILLTTSDPAEPHTCRPGSAAAVPACQLDVHQAGDAA
jgi:hypothetical protein